MLNRYLYIFVAASAMLLAGCFANYHHAELGPNDVVLALGDQFTSGGNVSESFRYTTVLGQNTNARIVNLGRSGAMVADAIPVLRENLAKHPNTRLVIVSLGYNDIIKGGSAADTIRGNLGADALTGNGGNDTFVFGFGNAAGAGFVPAVASVTEIAVTAATDVSSIAIGIDQNCGR